MCQWLGGKSCSSRVGLKLVMFLSGPKESVFQRTGLCVPLETCACR